MEIKPIQVPEEELKRLKELFASHSRTSTYKLYRARKAHTGLCIMCKQVPAFTVEYHAGGVTLIEKYCESCLKKENFI